MAIQLNMSGPKSKTADTSQSSNSLIKVDGLTKIFGKVSPTQVLNRIRGKPFNKTKGFKALDGISFNLVSGCSIGVIGLNGSGKSTLLQILGGTLAPSSGKVQVNGKVAALLELGSGFNPDFTGRENVQLNASLLGLSSERLSNIMDAILEFAEIDGFVDQPVRTYSTGMLMRLAFAVVVHVEPDILLVDEALAVGDFLFQLKCLRAMKQLQESGCTFLFVSHSLDMVQEFCDDVIFLDQGCIHFYGPAKEGIEIYEKHVLEARYRSKKHGTDTRLAESSKTDSSKSDLNPEDVQVLDSRLLGTDGSAHEIFTTGDPLRIEIDVLFTSNCIDPHCGVKLKDSSGRIAFGINTYSLGVSCGKVQAGDTLMFTFDIDQRLAPGKYTVNFGVASEGFGYPRVQFEKAHLYIHDVIVFTILRGRQQGEWSGPVLIPTKATCKALRPDEKIHKEAPN